MAEAPWLTIVGIGEDGWAGLSDPARAAVMCAERVMGAERQLALLPELRAERVVWPVPFADGIPLVMALRGRPVVVLVSGDPFWFGAGTVLARQIARSEWVAYPGRSTFALAAARLGWAIEDVVCLGLHAVPLSRLRPQVAAGRRVLVLLRDGAAVGALAAYLDGLGFGASRLHVLEALGGPRELVREAVAAGYALDDVAHPVAVGIDCTGDAAGLPCVAGRADDLFAHDGQITKGPMRALTLAALAPRPGESLWDIGAGSGSIAIEWLLAHPANRATAFEVDPVRVGRIGENALALGVDRLRVVAGRFPPDCHSRADGNPCHGDPMDSRLRGNDGLGIGFGVPDAVFVGGGLSEALLAALWDRLPGGTRLVANAVTLESEALLTAWHGDKGGALLRIELADAVPIGRRQGWRARYPVVQWSVVL